jgi:hypothetical protein
MKTRNIPPTTTPGGRKKSSEAKTFLVSSALP